MASPVAPQPVNADGLHSLPKRVRHDSPLAIAKLRCKHTSATTLGCCTLTASTASPGDWSNCSVAKLGVNCRPVLLPSLLASPLPPPGWSAGCERAVARSGASGMDGWYPPALIRALTSLTPHQAAGLTHFAGLRGLEDINSELRLDNWCTMASTSAQQACAFS